MVLWALMSINRVMAQEGAPKPDERVRDEGGLISAQTRFLLADYLETVAKTHKFEGYVVVLQKESFEEAAKLSGTWQEAWVKEGQGGVFVYSAKDRKFCYTCTEETIALVGQSKLMSIFQQLAHIDLTSVNDIGVVLPVQRILSAVEEAKLSKEHQKIEQAESQTKLAELQANRWKIVAGITGAAAAVGMAGWVVSGLALWGIKKAGGSTSGRAHRGSRRRGRKGGNRHFGGAEGGGQSGDGKDDRY